MLSELGFKGIFMVNPAIISVMLMCSVLLITVLLERLWYYASHTKWDDGFWSQVKAAVQAGRLHEARGLCDMRRGNVYAHVFRTAINSSHLTRADNEDIVQIAKENALERLRQRLGIFSTLSFISPLIGLLGTVMGIMRAFSDLGKAGSGGAGIVAAGIAEALVTTAAGILVAVPATILYNYFTYKLRSIGVRMNNAGNELIIGIYGGEEAGEKPAQPKASQIRAKVAI